MKRDDRLWFAFRICRDLGIDDPLFWLDQVGPMFDWWIAFYVLEQERVTDNKTDPMSPEQALDRLRGNG